MPAIALPSTRGGEVRLEHLSGWTVLFFYPMTARPGSSLPAGWDDIPGARGCTPQSCAFRDLSQDLAREGVRAVYGISTQSTDYQKEAAERLHLPFALLSDADLRLARALDLPLMQTEAGLLFKRLTLILLNRQIRRVFYPVFPPDRNPADVLQFMQQRGDET